MSLSLRGAGWRYPESVVGPVDLDVRPGELVLLTGPTGCGKSTVLRLAAGLLQRHGKGQFSGEVQVDGRDPATLVAAERVRTVAFVGQDPDDTIVTGTCAAEVAFAAESAGMSPVEIADRVRDLLGRLGLAGLEDRSPHALSGGQRQRLAIAAALSAGADVLLLDEPLSQLDPEGALDVLRRLRSLADSGVAVLLVEHRVRVARPFVDREVHMVEGRLVRGAGGAGRTGGLRRTTLRMGGEVARTVRSGAQGDRPTHRHLRLAGGRTGSHAANADRGGPSLTPNRVYRRPTPGALPGPAAPSAPVDHSKRPEVLRLEHASFAWPGHPRCITDVSLSLRPGERVAIIGANGAGKSTLLGLLSGRLAPATGSCTRSGTVVEVPQNPDLALFGETVREELAYGPSELGIPDTADRVAGALGLDTLLDRPPQALSRGQRLRVAVAAALTCRPGVLLLDEPTSGQDLAHVERVFTALPTLLGETALVFASHDLDVVRRHATRVLRVHGGRVVAEGPAAEVLGDTWDVSRDDTSDVSSLTSVEAESLRPRVSLDPRARLALLTCVGVLALTADQAVTLGTAALLMLTLALAHPRARGWRLRLLGGAALLAWSTAFSQSLFWAGWPRTPLFVLSTDPWLAFSREGLVHGLVQSLRFLLVTAAGAWVALSTPPDRLLTALLALRVPFGLALMGATALRFLPMVGAETLAVRRARASRGRPIWRRSPFAWLALEVALLRPVVARSLRRARALAESLETRGFHPTAPRAVREPLRWRAADTVTVGIAVATTLAAVVARVLYAAYGAELYYAPALRPMYAWVRGWL